MQVLQLLHEVSFEMIFLFIFNFFMLKQLLALLTSAWFLCFFVFFFFFLSCAGMVSPSAVAPVHSSDTKAFGE